MREVTLSDLLDMMSGSKFAIFMGAGCSVTGGIPISTGMVEELMSSGKYKHAFESDPKSDYFSIMSRLSPLERREVFSHYISNSRINVTSLIASQLLYDGFTKCIVTTNFDNLIPRAMALNIDSVPIYDATMSEIRPDLEMHYPSIVYLHGQVHGFWQLNTMDDLCAYRKSVTKFLRSVVQAFPVIVIGYSGNDHVVDILDAEFERFEHGLFWVPYKNEPIAEHVLTRIGGKDKAFKLSGNYDSDLFFYELANKMGVLEKYNNGIFEGVLRKLTNVNSTVSTSVGKVDVLSKSKSKVSVARDIHEDTAIGITKYSRKVKSGITEANMPHVATKLHESFKSLIENGALFEIKSIEVIATMFRDLGRLSRSTDLFEKSIYWASLAPHDGGYNFSHLIATNMCELGKLNRDYEPLLDAEPFFEKALLSSSEERQRISIINSFAVSRQDIANIILENDRGEIERAQRFFEEAKKYYEGAIESEKLLGLKDAKLRNSYSSLLIDYGRAANIQDFIVRAIVFAEDAESILHGQGAYNMACCYSLLGDKKKALQWMEAALTSRRHHVTQVLSDPDFEEIINDPDVKNLITRISTEPTN